jgi:hypothetical protein
MSGIIHQMSTTGTISVPIGPSVEIFSNFTHLHDLVRFCGPLLKIFRFFSKTVRPVLSKRPEFKTGCSVAYRHRSSGIKTLESGFTDSEIVQIGQYIRDIGISRDRCLEDTLVSWILTVRTLVQLGAELDSDLLTPVVDKIVGMESGKVFGISQPLIDALERLNAVVGSGRDQPLVVIHSTGSRVKYFDSEKQNVLQTLLSQETVFIEKKFRKEWMFFQSVNANWWEWLREDRWGFRLTRALADLSIKHRQSNCLNSCCYTPKLKTFLSRYLEDSATVSEGRVLSEGIELLATVDPRCSILIAVSFGLVLDALVRTSPSSDGGLLLETMWQTIAGEKFTSLVSSEIPLFELMNLTWSRL